MLTRALALYIMTFLLKNRIEMNSKLLYQMFRYKWREYPLQRNPHKYHSLSYKELSAESENKTERRKYRKKDVKVKQNQYLTTKKIFVVI